MAAVYSRVTIIGRQRQMDAVLPVDEPLGRLMPDLLRMLGEPVDPSPRRRYLTTPTGQTVSLELTLGSAQIGDGSVLRLAAEGEVPPPPTVYDVAEEAVDDLERRGTTFQRKHRRWASGAALIFALLAGAIALARSADADVAAFVILVVAILTGLGGVVLGRAGRKPTAVTLLVATPVLLAIVAWSLGVSEDWSTPMRAGIIALALALGPLLFAMAGLAGGGLVGGGTAMVFAVIWILGVGAGVSADKLSALVAAVAVLLLGVLPRLALSMSGLTALDDTRARGNEIGRPDVEAALNAAHVGLALAATSIALWSAAAGVVLALHGSAWSVSIAAVLALLLCARSRLYPLAVEVLGLFAAAGVVVAALVQELSQQSVGGTLVAVGLLVVVAMVGAFGLSWTPQDHVQVRLGQVLDQIQVLAVVALIPLVLGAFGVFSDLLDVF
ncbi:type VII secretion integral membrane protein EccD [Kribbella orskensis]|uniref:Type VII secretion integral membrane protein EccD n=1 Tax=Kribbella orskensis TaxID=2512216 RepID=A0ABY2BGM2_9ACTN|nr:MULTISPECIES: type VII secretion integral membrane protein EccD [Kribbella]TCN38028.1 type VII secretion integral membrane protein EccD [Kribbella sp. VKM Ac-2500]TCO19515.1 type VII secretion integral membrane protein EccD [Kribbella orskensis]